MTDINKLSVEELIAHPVKELLNLQSKLTNAIERRKEIDKVEIAKAIHTMAKDSGFTLDELMRVKVKKDKKEAQTSQPGTRIKEAKYRHPDDASKTWTGQGKEPNWLKALTGGDKDKREQYAI